MASSEDSDPQVLARMAHNADASVRIAVARNPSTPRHALLEMLADDNSHRRDLGGHQLAMAKNERADPTVLARIVETSEGNGITLGKVAQHPNATPQLLAVIAESTVPHARRTAREEIRKRLCSALDIHPDNTGAIEMLLKSDWWTLTPQSPEVAIARTVHMDP